jgi:lysozyme
MATRVTATDAELAAKLIKAFEVLRLMTYYCSGGKRTIGYGHVLQDYEQHYQKISLDIAENLLEQYIEKSKNYLYKNCKVSLSREQEAALVSFIFNCGTGSFQASTLRQKLNHSEYGASSI